MLDIFEFATTRNEYEKAKTALARARCGNQCSPYKSDQTSDENMRKLEHRVRHLAMKMKSMDGYQEYMNGVNSRKQSIRKANEQRIEALETALDTVAAALNDLPELARQNLPSDTALRDAIGGMRSAMTLRVADKSNPGIASLSPFEAALELAADKAEGIAA